MKIVVDKSRCAGHARCATVAPALFQLDENGYIAITEVQVPPDLEQSARRGVNACPERAIAIEES